MVTENQNIIIVEDLISTGNSAIQGAKKIKKNNCNILAILSVFDYEFKISQENMNKNKLNSISLTNLATTLKIGLKNNYITKKEKIFIEEWHNKISK